MTKDTDEVLAWIEEQKPEWDVYNKNIMEKRVDSDKKEKKREAQNSFWRQECVTILSYCGHIISTDFYSHFRYYFHTDEVKYEARCLYGLDIIFSFSGTKQKVLKQLAEYAYLM